MMRAERLARCPAPFGGRIAERSVRKFKRAASRLGYVVERPAWAGTAMASPVAIGCGVPPSSRIVHSRPSVVKASICPSGGSNWVCPFAGTISERSSGAKLKRGVRPA